MTQENIRNLDELLENTTVLLETIASEIVHSTNKIYASYPPGEIGYTLFVLQTYAFDGQRHQSRTASSYTNKYEVTRLSNLAISTISSACFNPFLSGMG